ncbi:hypothetical protein UFOVP908_25 [uncultured Caudovirales phage]|uniref:Uncharacterized protein n=1 Tax=uncultured Caudovirales phage TaxID=2100421 RepID=A0A6J5QRD3_9CAUD|nr:hypothetical protein UFOVP908_25 [uncultured Caudovirales phage]CAB4176964.1 hypothetical protein UFOVP990_111 [uncultured Caudovirales phage]CAB4182114.1 hypothetical protein UFOVP1065_142 [uncultured Caudovirales phage]CAB4190760.1 hypothetical protein UFOVP1198_111 [uncultured Caudovirales phage]CAB4211120.1 hypothetical protein UFOVP1418_103 [uncultured Caudovirales phage]
MIVSSYSKGNRRADIHNEGKGLSVYLYENDAFLEVRELKNYSIHYAESLAENFVEHVGAFYGNPKQLLVE